jgi:hypothetical protein
LLVPACTTYREGAAYGVSGLTPAILAADLQDPGIPFPIAGHLLSLVLVESRKLVKIDSDRPAIQQFISRAVKEVIRLNRSLAIGS